jgi:cytochrome c556
MIVHTNRCIALALLLLLAACSQHPRVTTPEGAAPSPSVGATSHESPFEVIATIRELMDFVVDPAADGLWDAVSIRYTQSGAEQRLPRTEDEWTAVRRNAVALAESMNLVVMDARHAAPRGTQAGLGELTPAEIDQRIATRRAEFVAFAFAVRAATQNALKAIDKRDADELLEVGGDIDAACEACHLTFWYPNQNKPPKSATAAQVK